MSSLLIKNGVLLTMNSKREMFRGDLLIKDNRIVEISASPIQRKADKVLDVSGKLVMPGFIQPHVHLTQALFRGQADDLPLLKWLKNRIWPLESLHDAESNYLSAQVGIAEMVRSGTTFIQDMGTVHFTESIMEAVKHSGFRAVAGKCIMDDTGSEVPQGLKESPNQALKESKRLLDKWHGRANGRIHCSLAPRFVLSSKTETFKEIVNLAVHKGVLVHSHAAENKEEANLVYQKTGYRNVIYFYKLGLLNANLVLAHCIWLNNKEKDLLAEHGVRVVHCPSANMKLGSGVADIPGLISRGGYTALASDGAPCNNNMDMFVEMRHAALLHKVSNLDSTVMPAEQVIEMATLGGAQALHREEELGSLEEGKLADMIVVNIEGIHNTPGQEIKENVISRLVYSARSHDVETTIVNGVPLMEHRELTTIDEEMLKAKANKSINHLLSKGRNRKLL